MYGQFDSRNGREFEQLLRDAISAVKTERRRLAQSLLRQAIIVNGSDARPYFWLSESTDDPSEKREYLEKAVAMDPSYAAARRSLAVLTGKLKLEEMLPEGGTVKPMRSDEAQLVGGQAFMCPQCGGRMAFALHQERLTCDFCGFEQTVLNADGLQAPADSFTDHAEQVLDFVMPTRRGHLWADAQQSLHCERCGALNLLPSGQKSMQCAYCGSNQMVLSSQAEELLEPQGLLPMKIDSKTASTRVKEWLGRGWFIPDDLRSVLRHLRLRPAYYSCWTFDGTFEISWTCEVKEDSAGFEQWEPLSGVEHRFFDDVLVPGVRALPAKAFSGVEPFNLKEIVPFKPDYLAGWSALIYDRSLADASLLAREKVSKSLRAELQNRIQIGREKRNLRVSSGKWSGMTFKHVLLPLWVGTYSYRGKEYPLLVNGHNAKVNGSKPVDRIKMILALLSGIMAFALLIFLLLTLLNAGNGF
jgi:ribosomal protein S27AE